MNDTLVMGAVAYDPKVVTIWDGFVAWFREQDFSFDYVLYSNYERQVQALVRGDVHVAWNSPLAWLQTERVARATGKTARAIAMRDTDRDLTSVIVVRADSPITAIADLRGCNVAVGASDSPQATLIPLHHLADAGLRPHEDFHVVRFDVLVGKHGDHIGGERDAIKALLDRQVDAACILDANHLAFAQQGTIPTGATRILAQTPSYDHCNFTVLDTAPAALVERFTALLMAQRYDDPRVRPLFDLEGLKAWNEGRTEGYAQLAGAVDRFGSIDAFVASLVR
jgi:phosphonate transport system substrate-binding protein